MKQARRYQLKKDAIAILASHPWLFREQLSTAAAVLGDGDWLKLVDGANQVVGYGVYAATGAIAIRMLRRGAERPDARWLRGQVTAALARRATLVASGTDGVRLIHGESDGIPAVVVDRFGDTLVAQSYAAGCDALARYCLSACATELGVPNAILRGARRRQGAQAGADHVATVRGAPPDVATFTEHGRHYAVDLAGGQKSGAYLDLRGLRDAIAGLPLHGARVLNLFAYTGMLGRSAELAGAAEITQVDASARALELARAHHVTDPARHKFVEADIFEWLPTLGAHEHFDLIIVDPPAMTSRIAQVPHALAAYRRLYRAVTPHVAPGGVLVAACCTGRITRAQFDKVVEDSHGGRLTKERELRPEPDHPVGFAQADYLKINVYRRARDTASGGEPPAA